MPTQSLFAKWPLWLRRAASVLPLVTLSLIAGCQGGCSGDSSADIGEDVPTVYIAHLQAKNAIWVLPDNTTGLSPEEMPIAGLPSDSAVTDLVALVSPSFATTLYMVSSSASSLVIATCPGPAGPFSVAITSELALEETM